MADTPPKARRVYVHGTLEERFWAHVEKTETCWLWTGARHTNGYGAFAMQTGKLVHKNMVAHRMAYELTYGAILPGLFCCHHCDNRPCVRPDHLFLGTATDNMQDMVRKRRHGSMVHPERVPRGALHPSKTRPELRPRGEGHPRARLTEVQVREIRRLYAEEQATQWGLARTFGVSRSVIQRVLARTSWAHVL
jgi:HNH endonuclease